MRILIFWDSITEWCYDLEKWGWVNILKVDYWNKDKSIDVTNLGIIWDEVVDVIKRFDIEVKSFTEKYNDDIKIVFAIWINDSVTDIEWIKNVYSINEFTKNLDKICFLAKKYTDSIYFLGLTKVNEKLVSPYPWSLSWKCYKNKRIKDFDNIIQNISKKNNIKYLSLFNTLDNEDLLDWIHPNSNWHKKIYKEVKEFINI
jgi:lysophospholipase L1-like esterase